MPSRSHDPSSKELELPDLSSTAFSWAELSPIATATGERRAIFDGKSATLFRLKCHATTLRAGEISHLPHRHPEEELVVVREGTLEVTIGDSAQTVSGGSVIFFRSGDLHGLRNAGDAPAIYHVIQWVSRDTPAATP